MIAPRIVVPEILDGLPADSPAARASRRDLRIINGLMGGPRWVRREVQKHHRTGGGVLELGAGDGELGRSLDIREADLAGLDLCPRPPDWPAEARWHQADVLSFEGWSGYPVVLANLFLHHFRADELARLGAQLDRSARVLLASEPLRARRSALMFSLVCPLMRAHPVTRHDGRVSIEAGFRGEELPRLLGLDPTRWRWTVEETGLAGYRLKAERRS